MKTQSVVCATVWILLTAGAGAATVFGTLPSANLVLGQPSFTASGAPAVPNPATLSGPTGVAVDPTTGKVFVADTSNNRILRYASASSLSATGANAEAVLGQINFSNALANEGSATPTAASLASPEGIHVDSKGRLWVADNANNRVLLFFNASTQPTHASADRVFGQMLFTTKTGAAGAGGMNSPIGVSVDSAGRLWTVEFSNHRVLRFDDAINKANGANADGVIGQPNFASTTAQLDANRLNGPRSVSADSAGRIWIADDNRVLRFDNAASKLPTDPADGVLGQTLFTTNTSGTSATTFDFSTAVFAESSGRVWVNDFGNSRVLYFDNAAAKANGGAADGVIGQSNFSEGTGGLSAQKFAGVFVGLWADASGSVWVNDTNDRILRFSPLVPKPVVVINGAKKRTTKKARLPIAGTATDVGGTLARVEIKVGAADFKKVAGTGAKWKFTVPLKLGKNIVLARAVDAGGKLSPLKKIIITRRKK